MHRRFAKEHNISMTDYSWYLQQCYEHSPRDAALRAIIQDYDIRRMLIPIPSPRRADILSNFREVVELFGEFTSPPNNALQAVIQDFDIRPMLFPTPFPYHAKDIFFNFRKVVELFGVFENSKVRRSPLLVYTMLNTFACRL